MDLTLLDANCQSIVGWQSADIPRQRSTERNKNLADEIRWMYISK